MKKLPLIFVGILAATSAITLAQMGTGTGGAKSSHGDSRYESGSGTMGSGATGTSGTGSGTDRGTYGTGSGTTGSTASGMSTGTTTSNSWNSSSSRARR